MLAYVYAMAMSVHLSVYVCLYVASRCSTKTAKHRIMQTTPYDSPVNILFDAKDLLDSKCRWGGLKSVTFDK